MYVRLKSYLRKADILVPCQYGFREKHSSQHATLDINNTIQNNMDNKFYTCGIFIDLKKAFDTVNHEILLIGVRAIFCRGGGAVNHLPRKFVHLFNANNCDVSLLPYGAVEVHVSFQSAQRTE